MYVYLGMAIHVFEIHGTVHGGQNTRVLIHGTWRKIRVLPIKPVWVLRSRRRFGS